MRTLLSFAFVLVFSFALFAADKSAELKTVDISVAGMTCDACVNKVKTSLQKVEGVKEAAVNLDNNNAQVVYDANKTNEKAN